MKYMLIVLMVLCVMAYWKYIRYALFMFLFWCVAMPIFWMAGFVFGIALWLMGVRNGKGI